MQYRALLLTNPIKTTLLLINLSIIHLALDCESEIFIILKLNFEKSLLWSIQLKLISFSNSYDFEEIRNRF